MKNGRWSAFRAADSHLIWLLILGSAVCLPFLLFDSFPKRDAAAYYIPMIEAFSQGNWNGAYYYLVSPLFSTVGGVIAYLTGADGYTSARAASSFFFVLTIIPLYKLGTLLVNWKWGSVASVLFVFCVDFLRLAGSGLLDTAKTFFLTLLVFLLFRHRKAPTLKNALLIGAAAAGLALARPEGTALAGFGILILGGMELYRRRISSVPSELIGASLVFVLLVAPWVYYQYTVTGMPVTDGRMAAMLQQAFAETPSRLNLPEDPVSFIRGAYPFEAQSTLTSLTESIFKALYPPYFIFLLPALYTRVRNRSLSTDEIVLLGIFFFHALLIGLALPPKSEVTTRYLIAAYPPILIICAWTVWNLTDYAKSRPRVRMPLIIGALTAVIVSLHQGYKPLHSESNADKRESEEQSRRAAQWISESGRNMVNGCTAPLVTTDRHYHSGTLPIVLSASSEVPALAAAEYVGLLEYRWESTLEDVLEICRLKSVNFVVVDERFRASSPETAAGWMDRSEFVPLLQQGRVTVLGFRPNLSGACREPR